MRVVVSNDKWITLYDDAGEVINKVTCQDFYRQIQPKLKGQTTGIWPSHVRYVGSDRLSYLIEYPPTRGSWGTDTTLSWPWLYLMVRFWDKGSSKYLGVESVDLFVRSTQLMSTDDTFSYLWVPKIIDGTRWLEPPQTNEKQSPLAWMNLVRIELHRHILAVPPSTRVKKSSLPRWLVPSGSPATWKDVLHLWRKTYLISDVGEDSGVPVSAILPKPIAAPTKSVSAQALEFFAGAMTQGD